MRGALLERCGGTEDAFARKLSEGENAGHGRRAFGHGAGLVDDKRRQTSGVFQRDRVANEQSKLRAAAGADDDRRGRGKSQRTGTRNDEHRDGIDDAEQRIAGDPRRGKERQHRDRDDDRHENARDAIGETLDRRLRALRLADETHDAGEQRRGSDAGRLAAQQTVEVHGAGVNGCARCFRDRTAFARQHRFVDRRTALDNASVNGNSFAGAHEEPVADDDIRQRHVDVMSVALDMRDRGLQTQRVLRARPTSPLSRAPRAALPSSTSVMIAADASK